MYSGRRRQWSEAASRDDQAVYGPSSSSNQQMGHQMNHPSQPQLQPVSFRSVFAPVREGTVGRSNCNGDGWTPRHKRQRRSSSPVRSITVPPTPPASRAGISKEAFPFGNAAVCSAQRALYSYKPIHESDMDEASGDDAIPNPSAGAPNTTQPWWSKPSARPATPPQEPESIHDAQKSAPRICSCNVCRLQFRIAQQEAAPCKAQPTLLQFFGHSTTPQRQPTPKATMPSACTFCERPACPACTHQCHACRKSYCTFCSTQDYSGSGQSRTICFDCRADDDKAMEY